MISAANMKIAVKKPAKVIRINIDLHDKNSEPP